MKLSLRSLITNIQRLSTHYPLLMLAAIAIMIFGLDMVRDRGLLTNLISGEKYGILIYFLIISLVIGAGIYGHTRKGNRIYHLLSILGLGVWRYMLPTDFATTHGIMMGVIAIVSLSRAVRGALPRGSRSLQDIHNRTGHIIQHVALGFIFSVILAGGLSLALAAIQALFGIHIDSERYGSIRTIVTVLVGIMTTLDGILFDQPNTTTPAKRQTIFARVISVLIVVFGVILYIYLAKILITRSRPSNEVSRRGFVFVGLVLIGTIILIPLLDYSTKKKQTIHTIAHLIIVPILITIAIAIYQRVAQYGITEMRYLTIALLLIIGGTSIWHLLTRRSSSYSLLVAISVAGLISIFGGPLSARNIAYHSQVSRLTDYLTEQGITIDLPLTLTDEQKKTVGPIFRYLSDINGRGLPQLHPQLDDHTKLFEHTNMEKYGHEYKPRSEQETYRKNRGFRVDPIKGLEPFDISKHSALYADIRSNTNKPQDITIEGNTIHLSDNNTRTASIDITAFVDHILTKTNESRLTNEERIIENNQAQRIIHEIHLSQKDETSERTIDSVRADILLP